MEVDWITVGAQIVNFLVLVWLLQRLLYRPVTEAMEKRATEIRDRFAEAERREAEAGAEAGRLLAEKRALEDARTAEIETAQQEAQSFRQRLEKEAREEIARRRAQWEEQLRRDRSEFLTDLRREAVEQVLALSRKLLGDLAGTGLEAAIAGRFIERLTRLDADARAKLQAEDDGITVTSAFAMPEPERARLRDAISTALETSAPVAFERDEALVCGIRLKAGGQTLQWSIDAYLDDLEAGITSALTSGDRAEAAD